MIYSNYGSRHENRFWTPAREAVRWIFDHKMLVFVYVPLITLFLLAAYTGFGVLGWQRDRRAALDRLFKYKASSTTRKS